MSLNSRLKSRKKKAFTLIELLVVIAIIALLLSILMPSLQKVKESAKNLICSTNLRTLFTAWSMYSASNDGKICNPYTYHENHPTPNFPWLDESSWAWLPRDKATNLPVNFGTLQSAKETVDIALEDRYEGIRRGSLWTYTGDVDVYRCLSAKVKYHFRSYSIADCMGGYRGRSAGDWNGSDEHKNHLKTGSITRPSNSYVFLEENDRRAALWDSFILRDGFLTSLNPAWADPMTVRHRGASSFVFADSHTEFYLWSKDTVEMMEALGSVLPPNPTTTIAVTPGEIKDIEWMIDHWSK